MKKLTDSKQNKIKIVLASKSPRRQELLRNLKLEFSVLASQFDEKSVSVEGVKPCDYVCNLASAKAMSVAVKMEYEKDVEYIIIGADTIVVLNDKILGQPEDEQDARRMLRMLSGVANDVLTGVCVISVKNGEKKVYSDFELTSVYFKKLHENEIDSYILTKEPMDKAGAYGIQGFASLFVEKIEGCYFNVVGLPIMRLSYLLEKHGYCVI